MKNIRKYIKNAVIMIVIMTLVCGVIYPLLITGISQLFFKDKANGSIITIDGKNYGSELLAQEFTKNEYLWGRVMLANTDSFKDSDGNALYYASPSNISPASDEYSKLISSRVSILKEANPDADNNKVPVDLVTCSGSGLDPEISVNAANYQISRIADSRGISKESVKKIIEKYTTYKILGVLGEDTVNVLKVNLALDGILK